MLEVDFSVDDFFHNEARMEPLMFILGLNKAGAIPMVATLPISTAMPEASPEFCIPTSNAIVRAEASSMFASFAAAYPITRPNRFCKITIASRVKPRVHKFSLPAAVMIPIMTTIPIIDTLGIALSINANRPCRKWLNTRPAMTGRTTILVILQNMPKASIGTCWPANQDISRGVMIGAIKVERAVSDRESARFAPAI